MNAAIPIPKAVDRRFTALSAADFEFVRALVHRHSAIALDADKHYLADVRLHSLARKEGFATLNALVTELRDDGSDSLSRKVVEAMTTNETSFFRDVRPFEALRTIVLPELIRVRQMDRRLRIWSAACSTGQEPYSVAMLLREHFPLLAGWDVQILASDISTEVLKRAREGRYSQLEVNRGLPVRMLMKHFTKTGDCWQIKDELRRMVDFRTVNLIGDWPDGADFDCVLLRNVLIYFDLTARQRILGGIRRLLRPWSFLFLGGAETTLNVDDAYERVQLDKTVCYQIANRSCLSGSEGHGP
jgi:chemotaxis protein methyltransferase CheR